MRDPWIAEDEALRERMSDPGQVTATDPAARLPAYATAFLAHLRLLVGVPFEYLVPDTALLPDESIRFFHLDRSWTDRLVDGVLAVGKVGSREQAHHQAAAGAVQELLDGLEPAVRPVQQGRAALAAPEAPSPSSQPSPPSPPDVSGFLLRSALVAGWPHMEVRAYRDSRKLALLRLERLSRSVLVALFAGIPDRIELEEPHHGVQFGVLAASSRAPRAAFAIDPRSSDGVRRPGAASFPVAVRAADPALRVLELADLRRIADYHRQLDDPAMPQQTGSAAFVTQLVRPPWKQVFSDEAAAGPPGLAPVGRERVRP